MYSSELAAFIAHHPRLFVLTGAGVSTGSGIPAYRDADGHWSRKPPMTHQEFTRSESARKRYWARSLAGWPAVAGAAPNAAHEALARLERAGRVARLVTQNVDGLHEAAGSRNVVHIHGKLFESRCAADCGRPAVADANVYSSGELPRCECGALLRPNVCWFGEQPYELDRVYEELENCDVFMAIGTSGSVQPVASFVAMLKQRGKPSRRIFVGLTEPENARHFDEVHLGPATEKSPQVLGSLLQNR